MRKLQWLKTKAGLFQDTRIMYLLSQPHGDALFVLWFFLKDLAASADKDGRIYVASDVPVTAELLARSLHKRKSFIEKGLDILEQIELIRRDEQGILEILIWDDLQDFRRDDVRREQNRQAAARYRQRQKETNGGEGAGEVGDMAQYEADTAHTSAVPGNAGRDESIRVDTAAQTGAERLANTQDCRDISQDSADAEDVGTDTTAQTERKASARTPSCREVPPEPVLYDDCRKETGRVDEMPLPACTPVEGYVAAFGPISAEQKAEVHRLVQTWGKRAWITAILIAVDNGVIENPLPYMEELLIRSGGKPVRGKKRNRDYLCFDEDPDCLLRDENEYESGLCGDSVASSAGTADRSAGQRAWGTAERTL